MPGTRRPSSNLGVMYDAGLGVPQDLVEAMAWYRQAAEQGYADAQYNLGLMYANGAGVPQGRCRSIQMVQPRGDLCRRIATRRVRRAA